MKQYQLVPEKIDLKALLKNNYWSADEPLNQIVLVTDNSGTLVNDALYPISQEMHDAVETFMKGSSHYVVLNSGDPLHAILGLSNKAVIESLSSDMLQRYFITTDGGATILSLNSDRTSNIKLQTPNWSIDQRLLVARILVNGFYNQLLKRSGSCADLLKNVEDQVIIDARDEILRNIDLIEQKGTWGIPGGPYLFYKFYIVPAGLEETIGSDNYIFDVGNKVTLKARNKPLVDDLDFVREIESYINTRIGNGLEQPFFTASGESWVDITRATKKKAVEQILRTLVVPKLDANKPILIVSIGDGGNDIPTFTIDLSDIPQVCFISVFLNPKNVYAGLLPDQTWVSLGYKTDGALQVIEYLNQITGKAIAEIPGFCVQGWVIC